MASFFYATLPKKTNIMGKYKKVLLKLSGESLMGAEGYGINKKNLDYYADEIASALNSNVSIGLVIGGGNIYRGMESISVVTDRVKGDLMGMLATLINSLALQSALESRNIPAKLLSGIVIDGIAEKASRSKANVALKSGSVVIFAGGTGNPFFTTDTAAALRAAEIEAEVLLKGTRVDGIYNADPEKVPNAVMLNEITFDEAIEKRYKILDITAFTLCRENNIPIVVFNVNKKGNLKKAIDGLVTGTLVKI